MTDANHLELGLVEIQEQYKLSLSAWASTILTFIGLLFDGEIIVTTYPCSQNLNSSFCSEKWYLNINRFNSIPIRSAYIYFSIF
jgi:hypothetical protein